MHGALALLDRPETGNAAVTIAIVIAHLCAGVGIMLVAADPTARKRDWRRADRTLLLAAFGLGLPAIAFASLALATSSRDSVWLAREAFGPLLIASASLPLVWLVAWTARSMVRSLRLAQLAGWSSLILAITAITAGSVVAAWCWSPASWIETRSVRSALLNPWTAPLLVARTAGAIATGGALVWAVAAPKLQPDVARRIAVLSAASALIWLACLAALGLGISAHQLHDPWTGVPAWFGPHAGRTQRLFFVALASSASAAAVGAWAARPALHERFAPAGFAALCVIAMLTFEQARATAIRPWAISGLMYANGTTVERAALWRRSTRIEWPAGVSRDALGPAMFTLQCSSCHDAGGARARAAERGYPETRTLLERLREADQLGNPYYRVMPPLVGDDGEIDSLARWMCGRP